MPAMNQLSNYATTIAQADGYTVVTYHRTQIVRWNDAEIILDFGGYDTVTTRRKMTQAARQFGLNYSVCRQKGETFVHFPGAGYAKYDGGKITFDRKANCIRRAA